ncbi:MAG: competence/damage-inducible protein A [Deltaproteobacteria bacterium]|nr:competence/damage-inducible protein A [Deltaproteobacteria bacterium]
MGSARMSKTAGIIIIGNEVLSGKTQDTNSHFLCQELRALGVEVQRVTVIPDEIELIGKEAASFSRQFDFVFTTGGVGPTHDDVTMAGVARGFGVRVVRHPELERRLRERHGENINEARLRMAEVPEGAELVGEGSLYAAVVKLGNIYIFPGIPKILHERFRVIKEDFRDAPFYLKVVYVKEGEGVIAAILNSLLESFPDLLLGSYPVLDNPDYKVKVTLESKDRDYLDRAFDRLLHTLPKGTVQRTEGS